MLFDTKLYRDDLWGTVKNILHVINTVRLPKLNVEDEITLPSAKSWIIGYYHNT